MNKRRTFLGFLTSSLVIPYLPALAFSLPLATTRRNAPLIDLLLDIVPDNLAARRLGRKILGDIPAVGSFDATADRLFAGLRQGQSASPEELRRHLDNHRRDDFAAGHTITVDGWIIAQCEADAIAIATACRIG